MEDIGAEEMCDFVDGAGAKEACHGLDIFQVSCRLTNIIGFFR
jgi:hypothetical protein